MPTPIWKYVVPRRQWDWAVQSPPEEIVGDYRIEIIFRGDLCEVIYWLGKAPEVASVVSVVLLVSTVPIPE